MTNLFFKKLFSNSKRQIWLFLAIAALNSSSLQAQSNSGVVAQIPPILGLLLEDECPIPELVGECSNVIVNQEQANSFEGVTSFDEALYLLQT